MQTAFNWDTASIAELIRTALEEDIGSGDATAERIVPSNTSAQARIIAKQDLALVGLPLAERVFKALDADVRVEVKFAEGTFVSSGEILATVSGSVRAILSAERVALNMLAHLSGIATLTRRFVERVLGTRAHIRDTRKTTPLLRALEKYAVRMGGGVNHRFGLFDSILVKENHVALVGGMNEAMRRARSDAQSLPLEVEVRNEEELRQALDAGADAVLLDNVSPTEAGRLTKIARRAKPDCAVEVSGGVTLSNVRAYADAGVDFIAVGALTHSAPAADISLLI